MKAAVYERFGAPDVLSIRELDRPVPDDDEVLIHVHATTVTSAEALMRQGRPIWGRVILGFVRPRRRMRILGTELAGDIAAVGRNVSRFAVGEAVFGFAGFSIGANAEYFCMPASGSLARKPANTSYQKAAAAADGASTAIYFLRDKAQVQPGQRVLVIGASGSIGTYAVQLAAHFGATVAGVCSGSNADLVTSLGATRVIDYTTEDFTAEAGAYDVIFDTVGKSSYRACRRALAPGGAYLSTTGLVNYPLSLWTRLFGRTRVLAGMSIEKNASLAYISGLLEADALQVVIDRTYPLDEIVEAHRYVDQGRKRGNVVVAMPASA